MKPSRSQAMEVGKLPPDLLARLLARVAIRDPRVLVGPRLGEDAALIDMGENALVVKSDPVTFAVDRIGWYAVQVNANDVACTGARPRWFLATVLLPERATPELAEDIFGQITDACERLGVTLVGGHTEVTYRLGRPIVVGHMLGEVERRRAVRTGGAQPGDAVVLTKGIAIEGTAVLAREAAEALAKKGVSPEMLERAREYLFNPGISVVGEALLASEAFPVHSMHDPTEGGLATALWEIAQAAGVGLDIDVERIPVLAECRAVCAALGLEPLGLLASGSLLIALPEKDAPSLIRVLKDNGIAAQAIGRVTDRSEGVVLHTKEGRRDLPRLGRDEVARYLSQVR